MPTDSASNAQLTWRVLTTAKMRNCIKLVRRGRLAPSVGPDLGDHQPLGHCRSAPARTGRGEARHAEAAKRSIWTKTSGAPSPAERNRSRGCD
jgi:hypothetical protein